MISLVLTVVGPDRAGLVNALSDAALAHGANWAESRMSRLAGQFAGIVHLQVAPAQEAALVDALRRLDAIGLSIGVTRGGDDARAGRPVVLDLVGQDRPGIVRDVSRTLAARSISIDELETSFESGSFSGETLFRARARLRLATEASIDELRAGLEAVANDLMVDIQLDRPD
jgi:glycine cleavage system regulatory protein